MWLYSRWPLTPLPHSTTPSPFWKRFPTVFNTKIAHSTQHLNPFYKSSLESLRKACEALLVFTQWSPRTTRRKDRCSSRTLPLYQKSPFTDYSFRFNFFSTSHMTHRFRFRSAHIPQRPETNWRNVHCRRKCCIKSTGRAENEWWICGGAH